jgi:hypothetical protein
MLHTRATNNMLNRTRSINQKPNLGPDQKNKLNLFTFSCIKEDKKRKYTKEEVKYSKLSTTLKYRFMQSDSYRKPGSFLIVILNE